MNVTDETKEYGDTGSKIKCPYCAETIERTDKSCRHCGSSLQQSAKPSSGRSVVPAIIISVVVFVVLGFFASSYFVSAPECDSYEAKNTLKQILVENIWKDLKPSDREWLLANIEFSVVDVGDSSSERFPKERSCFAKIVGYPEKSFDAALNKLAENGEDIGKQVIYGENKDNGSALWAALIFGVINFEDTFEKDQKFEEWKSGIQSLRKVHHANEGKIAYPINYTIKLTGESTLFDSDHQFFVSTNEAVNSDLEQATSIMLFGKQLVQKNDEETSARIMGMDAVEAESSEQYEDVPLIDQAPDAAVPISETAVPTRENISEGNGPSFYCVNAATSVERLICGSVDASRMDLQMSEAYGKVLDASRDVSVTKREQIAWTKEIRNLCQTEECLLNAYRERISDLGAKLSSVNDVKFVVQVAALSDADRANGLLERISEVGFPAYADNIGNLTRVRVGPYSSREEAVGAAVKLAEHGIAGQILQK